ncbi:transposase [Streptomyces desertarenae]|uniref:Transposase n=1 Tax=Streptomyces desertarenae TaxID=2666184 RepID=A0ABW4PK44_9ACTN
MQEFLEEVFKPLHRAEQHRWAKAYLQGLIHAPGRKTPRRMARTELLPPATAHGLHQFINASSWDWEPVRRRLALWVAANAAPYAWAVAELTIPKRGAHSVGVHRRLDTATGRLVNCQQTVGLFLTTDAHCFPVDWSLVIDGDWARDRQRRLRARIPEAETARPVGSHILGHAAAVAAQPRLPRVPWVLDLVQCDDAGGVLAGLARHRFDFVCEVGPAQPVFAGHHPSAVTTVGRLMDTRRTRRPYAVEHRTAGDRPRAAPIRVYAGAVRLPRHDTDRQGDSPCHRLLELRSPDSPQPARYWITNLTDRCVETAMALVRSRAAVRSTVTTLREDFGALDFAGRSFPGWHHHMTMVSAAYVHQRLHGAPNSLTVAPVPHAAPNRTAG